MRVKALLGPMLAALGAGLLALIVSAVAVLAGPPVVAQWSGRTELGALQQGSLLRTYRVDRPATLPPRPGLVLDLHSAHTNGFLEELATRMDAQADRHGWIVAYPDGVDDGWEPYGCCRHEGVDDVAFIDSLIRHLADSDGVDAERVGRISTC